MIDVYFFKNKDILLITITLKIKIDSNIILLYNPETISIFLVLNVVSVILFIAVIFSSPESNARTHIAFRYSFYLVSITLKEVHRFISSEFYFCEK